MQLRCGDPYGGRGLGEEQGRCQQYLRWGQMPHSTHEFICNLCRQEGIDFQAEGVPSLRYRPYARVICAMQSHLGRRRSVRRRPARPIYSRTVQCILRSVCSRLQQVLECCCPSQERACQRIHAYLGSRLTARWARVLRCGATLGGDRPSSTRAALVARICATYVQPPSK